VSNHFNIYASCSAGNKEPSRDDYTQSTPSSRPKSESLSDYEFGFKHSTKKVQWGMNAYYMFYKNQLVLTGKVNDVGAYTRTNVDSSYRAGVELEAGMYILKNLTWNMNVTYSENKIVDYKEYTDEYDQDYNYTGQAAINFHQTNIAFSPNWIAGSTLAYSAFKNFKISFISKYVGKQYLDNTTNEDRKLNAYLIDDLRLNYTLKTKYVKAIDFIFSIYNLFDKKYESNGYTYGYNVAGVRTTENFYYPQAGRNFLLGLKLNL
jgi:iron complex outermembrane recepter protein